jgi:hypothetical protein
MPTTFTERERTREATRQQERVLQNACHLVRVAGSEIIKNCGKIPLRIMIAPEVTNRDYTSALFG